MDAQQLAQRLANGHPRVQGRVRILEYHLDSPALANRPRAAELLAVEVDGTFVRLHLADDRACDRRLPAAGLTDDPHCLARVDVEAHVVNGTHDGPVLGTEADLEMADAQQRISHG